MGVFNVDRLPAEVRSPPHGGSEFPVGFLALRRFHFRQSGWTRPIVASKLTDLYHTPSMST